MSEYKTGRIYKINYIGNENMNLTYIGSTFNTTRDRFRGHKQDYNTWTKDEKKSKLSIYPYFEKYGIENFKIFLIKEYNVIDRKHLLMYEQLYINKIKCINIQKSFNPLTNKINKYRCKEYREKNKEKRREKEKEYYNINKENICEKKKEKYKENKELIKQKYKEKYKENEELIKQNRKEYYEKHKERRKEYMEKNKELIKQKNKEHYEKNKEKYKEKYKENKIKLKI